MKTQGITHVTSSSSACLLLLPLILLLLLHEVTAAPPTLDKGKVNDFVFLSNFSFQREDEEKTNLGILGLFMLRDVKCG